MTIENIHKILFLQDSKCSRGTLGADRNITYIRRSHMRHKIYGESCLITILKKDVEEEVLEHQFPTSWNSQIKTPDTFNKFLLFEDGTVEEDEIGIIDFIHMQDEVQRDKALIGMFKVF